MASQTWRETRKTSSIWESLEADGFLSLQLSMFPHTLFFCWHIGQLNFESQAFSTDSSLEDLGYFSACTYVQYILAFLVMTPN